MEQQAFEIIQSRLYDELQKQGFGEAVAYDDEKGKAVMFATEEVAYSLCFWREKSSYILQSTTLTAEGKPGTWRQLSMWLFDEAGEAGFGRFDQWPARRAALKADLERRGVEVMEEAS